MPDPKHNDIYDFELPKINYQDFDGMNAMEFLLTCKVLAGYSTTPSWSITERTI